MADNTVCAVDLGTHKIVALIGDISPEGLRITGVGKTSVNAVNSRGTITNIEELRTKVELAVEEAEKMADVQVNTVYVNLFGDNVECYMTRGTVTVGSTDIGVQSDDLSRVLSDVKNNFLLKDEHEIVHILARNFIVDEMTGIKDPIGIKGSRLEAEVYVVTAPRSLLSNIESVIENSGFELGDFVYEPLAGSEAVLSMDEKKLGAAVIDIGGAYTNVCVYKNGTILSSQTFPIGSSAVTNDLAIILRTSYEEAESMKIRYGNLYKMDDEDNKIEVFNTSRESVRLVSEKYVNEIIFARFEEIFRKVFQYFEKEDLVEEIKAGIIITGGGSQVEGLPVFVEHLFDIPARNGRPLSLDGLFDKINSPLYSTSVGILKYARKSVENSVMLNKGIVGAIKYKIKEFFETYF